MQPKNKLFIALDNMNMSEINKTLAPIADLVGGIKLGMEFWNRYNINGVKRIAKTYNLPLFLDLKLHDIPNTVANGLKYVLNASPFMTTIHALGGAEMIKSASNEIKSSTSPDSKLLAVTILTSLSQTDIELMGFKGSVNDIVLKLAENSIKAGADGIVCSPLEIELIRKNFGKDILIVTPGIRLKAGGDDQKRVLTPKEAIEKGSSYIVVGRPITAVENKAEVTQEILRQL